MQTSKKVVKKKVVKKKSARLTDNKNTVAKKRPSNANVKPLKVNVTKTKSMLDKNSVGDKVFDNVDDVLANKIVSRSRNNTDAHVSNHRHVYNDNNVYNNNNDDTEKPCATRHKKLYAIIALAAAVVVIIKILFCGSKKND